MKTSRHHDALTNAFAAAIVAVADHARAPGGLGDAKADEQFIRAMQTLADDQREFTRSQRIKKCLRVATDPQVG